MSYEQKRNHEVYLANDSKYSNGNCYSTRRNQLYGAVKKRGVRSITRRAPLTNNINL